MRDRDFDLLEARLEPVAERHQFINMDDDALLFGEGGRKRNENVCQDFEVDILTRRRGCEL
jgi:hypothetical protein